MTTGRTEHFNWSTVGASGSIVEDGYKTLTADRDHLDREAWLGSIAHKHDGAAAAVSDPGTGPTLVLAATDGTLPAGTRVTYKHTYVDAVGNETAPSPETYVDTTEQVATPSTPAAAQASTGGTLTAGTYQYRLAAYQTTSTKETLASAPVSVDILSGSTNKITLTLPSLPTGATGWNVYRRQPGGSNYFLLSSFASGPATFVDDGSYTPDTDRPPANANTTSATNKVTVSHPGGALPAGASTWRIYRTTTAGVWNNSLLYDGTATSFVDDGSTATTAVSPPEESQVHGSPSKINVVDGAEISGRIPMGHVAGFPFILQFRVDGTLENNTIGVEPWLCLFPAFKIVEVVALLDQGSTPAAQDVLVDVNLFRDAATPDTVTIFTNQGARPKIVVGNRSSGRAVPQIVNLVYGDELLLDVDQAGGGATPTDVGLTVFIYGVAIHSTTSSTDYDT